MTHIHRLAIALIAVVALAGAPSIAPAQTTLELPPIDLDNAPLPPGVDFGDAPTPAPAPGGDQPDAPGTPGAPNTPADSDQPTDDGDTVGGWQQKFYAINWRRLATSYAAVDGRFLVVPDFDPRKPSSLGASTDQWLAERTKSVRVSAGGGLVRTQKVGPSRDEAVAVTTRLPDLKPGSYGHVDSAKIVRIVNANEMLVTELHLLDPAAVARQKEADRNTALRNSASVIDAKVRAEEARLKESARNDLRNSDSNTGNRNRTRTSDDVDAAVARYRDKAISEQKQIVDKALNDRFKERERILEDQKKLASATVRVIGFPTAGQREGARWSPPGSLGPQIAVVDVPATGGDKTDADARGRNKTVTALNADLLRTGLTEEQFRTLLDSRGLTIDSFAELARPIMRQHPADSRPRIVDAIEKFGALTAAADKAAAKAAPADAPRPTRSAKPADTDFFDNK